MLRFRLISGVILAFGLLLLMQLDACLWQTRSDLFDLPSRIPDWGEIGPLDLAWCVYRGGISTGLALLFSLLATSEVARLYVAAGHQPSILAALLIASGLVLGPYLWYQGIGRDSAGEVMAWIALGLFLAFFHQASWHKTRDALVNVAAAVLPAVYIGGMLGFFVRLRMEIGDAAGAWLVLLAILTAKFTDIGAYFTGSAIGKRKLIPWLSPGKTWAGFWGGLLTGTAVSVALGTYLHSSGIFWLGRGPAWATYPWVYVIHGLVVGLVSVAGDLCESLLKRDAAVKDSGQSIPGMGGVLDVVDSLLPVAPAVWVFWTAVLAA